MQVTKYETVFKLARGKTKQNLSYLNITSSGSINKLEYPTLEKNIHLKKTTRDTKGGQKTKKNHPKVICSLCKGAMSYYKS
jgi:hypothetical protein